MDSSAGLGFRHTLYAVCAALVLHPGVRACSVDQKCCVFKAADSVFIGAGQLGFPAAALCVFDVHTADFCGKECRLVSAGTCAELYDNVLVIVRVFRQKQDFEFLLQLLYAFFRIGELFFQHFTHLFVGFLLEKHQALFDGLFLCFIVLICVCDRLEFCLLLHQLLELRRIGSDVRLA